MAGLSGRELIPVAPSSSLALGQLQGRSLSDTTQIYGLPPSEERGLHLERWNNLPRMSELGVYRRSSRL